MVANGAPAESCLDMGNRAAFANAGVLRMLHADLRPVAGHAVDGCCPRATEGPTLENARLTIAARSVIAA
ncbi:hypothetical protein GXW74_04660 [Roseomonas eburnea]|uniref:Uncharacterized protein n=1 Tax=Neoroseomonas eburnea TaxID=1346889 RepID=A0A9X9X7T0_9PROT|nr:hypothetical protein [Neoroseomonas eburnea]MBR0679766.1 hypothetical protein [Neoroseomonas eburnea]